MKDKIRFIGRWIKSKYYYVRFRLAKAGRKKAGFRLLAKEAYKNLYR